MNNLLKQLEELATLAAHATEGPWSYAPAGDYDAWVLIRATDSKRHNEQEACDFASVSHIANAAFITAARNLLTPESIAAFRAGLLAEQDAANVAALLEVPDGARMLPAASALVSRVKDLREELADRVEQLTGSNKRVEELTARFEALTANVLLYRAT